MIVGNIFVRMYAGGIDNSSNKGRRKRSCGRKDRQVTCSGEPNRRFGDKVLLTEGAARADVKHDSVRRAVARGIGGDE